jgi:CheY-like chemotaxis protein
VVVTVDDAADAMIDGDPELLHRALVNLVLNAAQASPAGGRVRVDVQLPSPRSCRAGSSSATARVAVHVRDQGPGIAPGLLGRLFDPFFTTSPGAAGLGLAVVQRAVEAHRGVVLVEGGGGGVGARFTLLLPRAAAGDAAPALPTMRPYLPTPQRPRARRGLTPPPGLPMVTAGQAVRPHRRRRASIVETLRILLKTEGFTTHTAVGRRAGLEQLGEVRPDIVVSDVRMPGVDGLQLLAAAREHDAMLPVILMTAQATLQTAIQAVNDGAFYYLQKPFRNDDLVAIGRAPRRRARCAPRTSSSSRRSARAIAAPGPGAHRAEPRLARGATACRDGGRQRQHGPRDRRERHGKEVVARWIHERSSRARPAFASINCGALPSRCSRASCSGTSRAPSPAR